MSRTALAYLVAPLWVPAATAIYALHMFPYPEQHHWIYVTIIIGAVFGYAGTLALGMPAFFVLRARSHTALWTAVVLGFGIGGLTWLVFTVLFVLSLGNSFTFILHEAANPTSWLPLLPTGVLGSIVGATWWLVARPDRVEHLSS